MSAPTVLPEQFILQFNQLVEYGEGLLSRLHFLKGKLPTAQCMKDPAYNKIRDWINKNFPNCEIQKKFKGCEVVSENPHDVLGQVKPYVDILKDVYYYRNCALKKIIDFFNGTGTKNFLFAPDYVKGVVNATVMLTKLHLFLSTMDLRTIFGFYLVALWYSTSGQNSTEDVEITQWITNGIFVSFQSSMFELPPECDFTPFLISASEGASKSFNDQILYSIFNIFADPAALEQYQWDDNVEWVKCRTMFFDWYAFLPLVQPSLLCKESVRGMLEYVLCNGYCYPLYRDVCIRLHDYYYDMIAIISSKKLFTNYKEWKPFHKKDHILSLEGQANTGSGLMHQTTRGFVISQLQMLYSLLLNDIKIIGKIFNHVLCLLSLAQWELRWINAHTFTPPAERKSFLSSSVQGSYNVNTFRDPNSQIDLIFYIFQVTRLVQSNLYPVQDYYIKRISQYGVDILFTETKPLPRSNGVKKACEQIASFSHAANNYDMLMNFYLDCYRIMVAMPALQMTDAGVEDRMFQRQVAALSCIRQMPLCAMLAYDCYNFVRQYGSLKDIWWYRSFYLPLITSTLSNIDINTQPNENIVGLVNTLMDAHENLSYFNPESQATFGEELINTAHNLLEELSKGISTAIMNYLQNVRLIDKSVDPPADFIQNERIKMARKKGDSKGVLQRFGAELFNEQVFDIIESIDTRISFVLSRMKQYVGINGNLDVYNHSYRPLIMIRQTVYSLIKEHFITLSFDANGYLREPRLIYQDFLNFVSILHKLSSYANIGLQDIGRDLILECTYDNDISPATTFPQAQFTPISDHYCHQIGKKISDYISQSIIDPNFAGLLHTLLSYENMTSLVQMVGVPGIKIIDSYIGELIHGKCADVYYEMGNYSDLFTTYLKAFEDGNVKPVVKNLKQVLMFPTSILTVGLAVYYRKIMWETVERNNNDAIPMIVSTVETLYCEVKDSDNPLLLPIQTIYGSAGHLSINVLTAVIPTFLISKLEKKVEARVHESKLAEYNNIFTPAIKFMFLYQPSLSLMLDSFFAAPMTDILSLGIFTTFRGLNAICEPFKFSQWFFDILKQTVRSLIQSSSNEKIWKDLPCTHIQIMYILDKLCDSFNFHDIIADIDTKNQILPPYIY